MWRSAGPITFVSILTAVACGSTDAGNGDGAGPSVGTDGGSAATPDGGVTSTDGGTATTPHDDCPVDEKTCSGALVAHVCESTPEGTRWKDEPCASGQGCVQGACAPAACSDECAVGDVQGGKTCALYDVTNGTWGDLDAATKLSDRARAYAAYLRKNEMAFGGVASMHYTDATLATPDAAHGIGDSSIWTGTYLASEALRAMATGSKDAHDEIVRVVKTLDLFFHVSGEPATLSRFVRETGANPGYSLPDLDCANTTEMHCNVTYMGKQYDALGHISRDQYQGFMLGMTLAYEALGSEDEDTRAVIRGDIVALVKELMTDRSVPATIKYKGVPINQTITMRFIVLNHSEMQNGRVVVDVDGDDSGMYGLQEFTPDLSDVVKQLPGLSFAPSIPRSSSAMMLASFFRDALRVTDGVAASKADHDAILDYYLHHSGTGGNVDDWLKIAKAWSASNDCGDHYYANNIAMEPMYNLARLEDDAGRKAIIDGTLGGAMWNAFKTTKNSFFTFITAANVSAIDPAAVTSAMTELAQFPAPPRVLHAVDQSANPAYMPHSSSCAGQVDHSLALDVGDRIVEDFLWQRQPWGLTSGGDTSQTEPGVDYLVAYWMARHHAFTTDDDAGKCLAWH